MPPLPGEERLLTVFADIHYYFTDPTPKPLQHRFDKGSYLYLYHNATQRKTRLEVANHPGSPEQDAFNGGLDNVHFLHSTNFPTLCTLTVERETRDQHQQAFPPPPGATSACEWQLPSGDPRDGSRALLRLHTLDIYFWTQDDATQFLDLVEVYLPQTNISTDRHPYPPPPQSTVNPVVQQLENIAISDPAYQHGHTRGPGGESVSSTPASTFQTAAAPSALPLPPPPPLGGPSPPTQQTAAVPQPPAEAQRDSPQCAPLPYNPAAPAAPEPIQHREKTPPPVDAGGGTGLATAAVADNGVPHSPPPHLTGAVPAGYAPPPPSAGLPYNSMPGGYVSPPPSAGLPPSTGFPPAPGPTHSASLSSRSSVQSPPGVPSYAPSFLTGSTGSPQPAAPTPPGPMSFAPPPRDPNAHLYSQPQQSPGLYAPAPPPPPTQAQVQQPVSSPPPVGGYSNYTYDSTPQRQQSFGSDYDIHNQLYRPTEAEAGTKHQKYAQKAVQNPGSRPRKLEDGASRVEAGVSRLFKKLEKRL
ncbi:hypothetical protein P168DRAFT_328564 [Aspergillus campestris IBT 28561]|uniref:RNA recognition motif-containing protein n=1 Tax=Aspergillus campestris (strain IBT 28561) TaxID=1392248 RepID=A0A2I1CY08_ASPC2|nr:uncharacterized protein P168DRAFT_328564 [Aspergillus campestris IBT 28561]PKY02519.1 hypothetical protein P168DRAFT_328564 [Aspergillus campestris IBT 28561]